MNNGQTTRARYISALIELEKARAAREFWERRRRELVDAVYREQRDAGITSAEYEIILREYQREYERLEGLNS